MGCYLWMGMFTVACPLPRMNQSFEIHEEIIIQSLPSCSLPDWAIFLLYEEKLWLTLAHYQINVENKESLSGGIIL